jgi:hypothetical protein
MDELLGMSADEVTVAYSHGGPAGASAHASSTSATAPYPGSSVGHDDQRMVVDSHVGEDITAAMGVKGEPSGPLVLEITDFSPAQDHQVGGGTKVLICLGNEIPKHLQGNTIKVSAICV